MALWVLRGGRSGERERRMLEAGVLAIGWQELADLSQIGDRGALEAAYRATYPDAKESRVSNHAAQLDEFLRAASTGDLVVLPLSSRAAVAVAEITGDYAHRNDLGPGLNHTRPVRWLRRGLPRPLLDKDLIGVLDGFSTFTSVPGEGVEEAVRRLAADTSVQDLPLAPAPAPTSRPVRAARASDIEREARDQILDAIGRRFRGRELVRLVQAVLQAQGFRTGPLASGAAGEAHFLAAAGPIGLDRPHLCVRIESPGKSAWRDSMESLKQSMESGGAEQGLLVCWGRIDRHDGEEPFYQIRLWEPEQLLDALLDGYDRLSEEIRAELPLKRIWSVAYRRPLG